MARFKQIAVNGFCLRAGAFALAVPGLWRQPLRLVPGMG